MQVPVHSMTHVAPTIAEIIGVPPPAQSQGEPIAEVLADLNGCRRCALLVPDGFGMYAWSLWHHEMPFLASLMADRHVVLRAVMPTITPVNFATMLTGAEQDVHRIQTRDEQMQCETLFDVLGAHGKRGAAYGQEPCTMGKMIVPVAQIGRRLPRYEDDQIVDTLLDSAAQDRPEFIITQLVTTDDVFHKFGPSSPEVVPYLHETDVRLKRLVEELRGMDYAILILSDHGQHDGQERGTHGSDCDEDSLVPCTWVL